MKLIDKDALAARIKKLKMDIGNIFNEYDEGFWEGRATAFDDVICALTTLEVKEVDLEKLGEIARHLIAEKEHIEDMRLDKEEWFLLEKIGYPERFKAHKGE